MKAIPYGKEHLFFPFVVHVALSILYRVIYFFWITTLFFILFFVPIFSHTLFSLSLFQSLQVTIMPLGAPVKEEAWATLNHDTEQAEMVMMLFMRRKIYSRPSTGLVVGVGNTKKTHPNEPFSTHRVAYDPRSEKAVRYGNGWREGG